MIENIVLFIAGLVSFFMAYLVHKELQEGFFEDESNPVFYLWNRIGILMILHALISPWAYFKPWKIREGYPLLLAMVLSTVLGFFCIIKSFNIY